jgi:hypothetical protein
VSIFEAGMLICFGAAWPVEIVKSWRDRSARGKSLGFLIILIVGYINGITHKLLYNHDIVLLLYIINLILVATDLLIYFRNRALDKQRDAKG